MPIKVSLDCVNAYLKVFYLQIFSCRQQLSVDLLDQAVEVPESEYLSHIFQMLLQAFVAIHEPIKVSILENLLFLRTFSVNVLGDLFS
jgi:hypothetical protein